MSRMDNQLALDEAILALIETKRAETGDETLGWEIERVITEAQFRDVERDILDNPGAFEPWLIKRRAA